MIDEQLGNFNLEPTSTNPKELFDNTQVESKTELTGEQVLIIARFKLLGKYFNDKYKIDYIDTFIQDFLKLQISKDRKSREEFVSAFQSKNDERAGGLMDKIGFNVGGK